MARPFIPMPNVASVEMIYTVYSQVIENVFHVQSNAPFSATDIVSLRNCFNSWDTTYQSLYRNSNVLLARIRTKGLDAKDSPMEDYALASPRGGALASAALPLHNTFCFKLGTGAAGRSQRGRLYIVGFEAAAVSGNQVILARITQWLGPLNQLPVSLAAANPNWKWGVVSWRADKAWRPIGKFTPITTVTYTDTNIDSQRRRLTGRGRT